MADSSRDPSVEDLLNGAFEEVVSNLQERQDWNEQAFRDQFLPRLRPAAAARVARKNLDGPTGMQHHPKSDEPNFVASAQIILDALAVAAAVLNRVGEIVAVNRSWREFSLRCGNDEHGWVIGSNYLDACDRLCGYGDEHALSQANGIKSVLTGNEDEFLLEGRSHRQPEARWFQLRVNRLVHAGESYALLGYYPIAENTALESERERLLIQSERHRSQLEELAAASVEIAAAGTPEATIQAIADQARRVIPACRAEARMSGEERSEHYVAVSLSRKHRHSLADVECSCIFREVAEFGRAIRLGGEQLSSHPIWLDMLRGDAEHPTVRNLMAAPISGNCGSIGVIMLFDRKDGEFSAEDEAVLMQFAQTATVCLRNAQDAKLHREGEERLQATQEHANIAIGECDAEGRYVRVNSGFSAVTGFSREELLGRSFFDLTHPEDLAAEREWHRKQLVGEQKAYATEKRFRHKDGSIRWALLSASAVCDAKGRFRYAIRVLQDIDQRKRAEERQAAQVRELHHRVRNTLATVQGIMGATARSVQRVDEFKRAFSGRLAAIARAHTLLTTDDWETASLKALLQDQIQALEPRDAHRISLVGPHVDLPASLAVPLSMAIHELADNATRHGALSTSAGGVEVDWSVRDNGDGKMLVLNWLERNGPPVEKPIRTGYGTVLLAKVLPAQSQAAVRLDFARSGLSFRLEAPLVVHPPQ